MGKRIAAVLLAACLLAGCAARSAWPSAKIGGVDPPSSLRDKEIRDQWQATAPSRTSAQRRYGSAGLLAFPSVLVSLYLDEDGGAQWTDEDIAHTRANVATAVDWIKAQAAAYNANPVIYYDTGDGEALFCRRELPYTFMGGEESEEGDELYAAIESICDELDTDALHDAYGTSSVGFLVFLPVAGSSFTMVHYLEDDEIYYHEYSCIYRYDAYGAAGEFESPAVYAHEILHMYGAPDLYLGSGDPYVTPALVDYIEQTWPDAIMLYTYNEDGTSNPDSIPKTLCPVTACRLGLCDTFEGAEEYPDVSVLPQGTFALELPDTPASPWDLAQDSEAA